MALAECTAQANRARAAKIVIGFITAGEERLLELKNLARQTQGNVSRHSGGSARASSIEVDRPGVRIDAKRWQLMFLVSAAL